MIDKRISAFITRHHVLTLATVGGAESHEEPRSQPWCSNMFYVFDAERVELIVSSSDTTRHIAESAVNERVACSIVLESKVIGRLQGAQITARIKPADTSAEDEARCRKLYLKRFPYAALHLDRLWIIEIDTIKLTDNTLGFGKKLHFNSQL